MSNINTNTNINTNSRLKYLNKLKLTIEYYFLYIKDYEESISELNDFYKEGLNETQNEKEIDTLFLIHKKYTNLFPNNLYSSLSSMRNIIDDEIYRYCKHDFINDYIDIDLDKTISITYCKYCNLNKK